MSNIVSTMVCLVFAFPIVVAAQSQSQSKQRQQSEITDDVVRVSTELVQSGVIVLDKKGRFVRDLSRQDFEVKVDNKPQPLSFFELVTPGSRADQRQSASTSAAASRSSERGRTVLFFIDDFHLTPESTARVRRMLSTYIERMHPEDQALIAAPSGQLGFLQQLTGDKSVLRAAVGHLRYRSSLLFDNERPAMSVGQALAIERNDRDVIDHFVTILTSSLFGGLAKTNANLAGSSAEQTVRTRARRIIIQSDSVNTFTLSGLENLIRSSSQIAGRKLGFFVSDGFPSDPANSTNMSRLQRIADAAVRAGVVMYSLQASGLAVDFPEASSDATFISGSGTGRAPLGSDTARQTPLVAVAAGTGGRALLNTNDLDRGVTQALKETGEYYLLAWRPDPEIVRDRKFHRISVSLNAHPDLTVRVQEGFFSEDVSTAERASVRALADPAKFPLDELVTAIRDAYSKTPLPTYLTVSYLDDPKHGLQLTILMQVPLEDLPELEKNDNQPETIDIAGAVFNEKGKLAGSFLKRLNVSRDPKTGPDIQQRNIIYLDQVNVKPGLYQVRVAVRHNKTGSVGKAMQWIDVPDLIAGQFAVGSILIGERTKQELAGARALDKARLKIDNRFRQQSQLRLLTYIYNAAHGQVGGKAPDVEIEIQILRDNQRPISRFSRKVKTDDVEDMRRIPLAEDLSLTRLSPGTYILRLVAMDHASNKTASQETRFEIE